MTCVIDLLEDIIPAVSTLELMLLNGLLVSYGEWGRPRHAPNYLWQHPRGILKARGSGVCLRSAGFN